MAVYVACSTLCFGRYPLDRALRMIADLEFNKVDVAIQARGPHLTPSDVVEDPIRVAQLIRIGPGLVPCAFNVEIEAPDQKSFDGQFQAICKLARASAVATMTIPAAPVGSDLKQEVQRLHRLVQVAEAEGIILTVETRIGTLTETPAGAIALCDAVDGLGLTLDPSHYICGPHQGRSFDDVYPYVRHVHLRDTGRTPDKMQVLVGQGEIEYSRVISLLERYDYDRLLTVEIIDIPDAPFYMETEVRKLKYLLESLV
jgi:sugar phosphate isomerase/epimerase